MYNNVFTFQVASSHTVFILSNNLEVQDSNNEGYLPYKESK